MQLQLTRHERYTIVVICFINLAIYIDRLCVISMEEQLSRNYDWHDNVEEELHFGFLLPYMLMSPIYGYLGDRYSRAKIMIITILFWSISTFVSTIAPTSRFFVCTRICVGAFQAGFCVIAPSVLADIVRGAALSQVLSYFYITIPVGGGIGFILTTLLVRSVGHWVSLLIAALIAFAGGIFLFFGLDPKRGFKDTLEFGKGKRMRATPYKQDLLSLMKNKSFILVSLALACLYFWAGVISWFGPELLTSGHELLQINREINEYSDVNVKFGAVTILTGVIGVPLGTKISRLLRPIMPRADTIICGWGVVISVPLVIIAVLTSSIRTGETFFYIFFGQIAFNVTWAVSNDILLYIVIPTRRCSVFGWHSCISHALGDCIGPIVVKELRIFFYKSDFSDLMEVYDIIDLDVKKFYTLRNSILSVTCVQFASSIFFILNGFYILQSIDKAKKETLLLTNRNKVAKVTVLNTRSVT